MSSMIPLVPGFGVTAPITPLPPSVAGPIYPISPTLHLLGVYPGALVTIQGTTTGALGDVGSLLQGSDQWLPFTKQPVEGEFIVVSQKLTDGSQSVPSNEAAAQVIAVPEPLPCPNFLEPIHNCTDFITLDSLIPGADVVVEVRGNIIIQSPVSRPTQSFPLDKSVAWGVGDVFRAHQTLRHNSDLNYTFCMSASLPVEDLKLQNPLATPFIDPVPVACQTSLILKNLVEGASVYLENKGASYSADNVPDGSASIDWAPFNIPWTEGDITVQQTFARCNLQSPIDTQDVAPAPPLTPPEFDVQPCLESQSLYVKGLNVPAELQIERLVAGHPELTQIRRTLVSTTIYAVPLGDLSLTDPNGVVSFRFLQQTNCGMSEFSAPVSVKQAVANIPRPVIVSPLFECSHFVHVQQATPSCDIAVLAENGEHLSDPVPVVQDDFFIHTDTLHRPLIHGDKITILQTGCGTNLQSDAVAVSNVPLVQGILPSPQITNLVNGHLRYTMTEIDLNNVIPGAFVSVRINGQQYDNTEGVWQPVVEATSDTLKLTLPRLLLEGEQVVPYQEICGNTSSLTKNPITVTVAQLSPQVSPNALTRGVATTVSFNAVDSETGERNNPHWGEVSILGRNVPLGGSLRITAGAGATIQGQIGASAYNHETPFQITVRAPPPPPPPPPPMFTLQLSISPVTFATNIPLLGGTLELITFQSVTWSVNTPWTTPATYNMIGAANPSLPSSLSQIKKIAFPPGSEAGPITVTGTAIYLVPNVGTRKISLNGHFVRDPGSRTAKTCMQWFLEFTINDDGSFNWGLGPPGPQTGPRSPTELSC